MTMAALIITIIALLFAIAAMVFFRLKAPTVGAVFATLALANDDASDHGIERAGEGGRLAARPLVRWINIRGAGRGGLN